MTLEDSLKVERKQWLREGREEGRIEGRDAGLKEGREEAKYEDVDRLVEEGTFDAKRACEILEVSLDDYKKYKKEQPV